MNFDPRVVARGCVGLEVGVPLDKRKPPPKNGLSGTRSGAQLVPFRMRIDSGEKTLRMPLLEGEWVVGSAADADIRITHPTVSRRHARLFVGADGVEVEDLGSSNGTRVDGNSVRGRVEILPGKPLLFGTACAELESLERRDSEVGIGMGEPGAEEIEGSVDSSVRGMTTLAPSVLEDFTALFLPGVLEQLGAGVGEIELIQTIGSGLFDILPCRSVEISRVSESSQAVVFSAERKSRREVVSDPVPIVLSSPELVFTVVFPVDHLARAYEPLVRSAVMLAGMTPGKIAGGGRVAPIGPQPPAPPSP